MKRFPKKITVTIKEGDKDRYFVGREHYKENVWNLLLRGLKTKELDDLMLSSMILATSVSAHYKYFSDESSLGIFMFASDLMEVKVDVKFIGNEWNSGQIEKIVIHIITCKVPKVMFT